MNVQHESWLPPHSWRRLDPSPNCLCSMQVCQLWSSLPPPLLLLFPHIYSMPELVLFCGRASIHDLFRISNASSKLLNSRCSSYVSPTSPLSVLMLGNPSLVGHGSVLSECALCSLTVSTAIPSNSGQSHIASESKRCLPLAGQGLLSHLPHTKTASQQ